MQSILETVALFVLPVTLLILLVLIALGINGNVSAQLEPQPSNLLAFAWLASGAA